MKPKLKAKTLLLEARKKISPTVPIESILDESKRMAIGAIIEIRGACYCNF